MAAKGVGDRVVVTNVYPQSYRDATQSFQRAEMSHVGQFLYAVGTVVAVDGDRLHPVTVQFSDGRRMRFSQRELGHAPEAHA